MFYLFIVSGNLTLLLDLSIGSGGSGSGFGNRVRVKHQVGSFRVTILTGPNGSGHYGFVAGSGQPNGLKNLIFQIYLLFFFFDF